VVGDTRSAIEDAFPLGLGLVLPLTPAALAGSIARNPRTAASSPGTAAV
jgi:hypothetical protein